VPAAFYLFERKRIEKAAARGAAAEPEMAQA
jgi:hypothetical protein